jgi:hypothetical protein
LRALRNDGRLPTRFPSCSQRSQCGCPQEGTAAEAVTRHVRQGSRRCRSSSAHDEVRSLFNVKSRPERMAFEPGPWRGMGPDGNLIRTAEASARRVDSSRSLLAGSEEQPPARNALELMLTPVRKSKARPSD